jgi:hypothetical protein
MSLVKVLDMSREELIKHIEYLEERYEPVIEKEIERNYQNRLLNDWDSLFQVYTNNIHMTDEERIYTTYNVSKEKLNRDSKIYETPFEWIVDELIDCQQIDREPIFHYDIHLDWKRHQIFR